MFLDSVVFILFSLLGSSGFDDRFRDGGSLGGSNVKLDKSQESHYSSCDFNMLLLVSH